MTSYLTLITAACVFTCLEVPKPKRQSDNPGFLTLPPKRETILPAKLTPYVTADEQNSMERLIESFTHAAAFYAVKAENEIQVSDFNNSFNFDRSRPLPVHQWPGVHTENGKVTRIKWQNMDFSGTFAFKHLPRSLKTLFIDGNNFDGTFETTDIPPSIGYMSLERNHFQGTVDWPNLPASLTFLDIRHNSLSGEIDLRMVPRTLRTVYIRGNSIRVTNGVSHDDLHDVWGAEQSVVLDQSYSEGGSRADESFASPAKSRIVRESEKIHSSENSLSDAGEEGGDVSQASGDARAIPKKSFASNVSASEPGASELSGWYLRGMRYLVYFLFWVILILVSNVFGL